MSTSFLAGLKKNPSCPNTAVLLSETDITKQFDEPSPGRWQQTSPPEGLRCPPAPRRRSTWGASPAARRPPRKAIRSWRWPRTRTPSGPSRSWHGAEHRRWEQAGPPGATGPANTHTHRAMACRTVGRPSGDLSLLRKVSLSSRRLQHTVPRCRQLFRTRDVQKSILLSQSVGLTSRFVLKSENMNSIRSSSSHSGVSAETEIGDIFPFEFNSICLARTS